jgi:glutamyl-tRNA synthetase
VLKNHPKKPEMGERKVSAQNVFYVPAADADALAVGETFRLKDLYNCVLGEKKPDMLVAKYDADEGLAARKIQWVNCDTAVSCKVKVPRDLLDENGNYRADSMGEDEGVCEPSCRELQDGAVVQFERYGYARLDKKGENGLVFVFSC